MAKMTVYHGSYMPVEHPQIRVGRNTKDFGAMANNQIYNYVSDYIDGAITREQFWVLAKFKYPTHQINFCTEKSLQCLEYRGFEEVW